VTHCGGRERDPRRFFICSQNLLLRTANSQSSPGAIKQNNSSRAPVVHMSGLPRQRPTQCHRRQRHQAPVSVAWQHRLSGALSHSVFRNSRMTSGLIIDNQEPEEREFPLLAPCRPGPDVVAPPASGLSILGSPCTTPITPADTPPGHSCGAQGHENGRAMALRVRLPRYR
jgi:hypothetical protein